LQESMNRAPSSFFERSPGEKRLVVYYTGREGLSHRSGSDSQSHAAGLYGASLCSSGEISLIRMPNSTVSPTPAEANGHF